MSEKSNLLSNIIQSIFPMSEGSRQAIEDLVEIIQHENGTTFIKESQLNSKEYFILEGICRSYVYSPEGEEITISFFSDKSVLSPYMTRTRDKRSNLNFQALTDLTLGAMDAAKFENLMIENLEIREFGNTVLRNELRLKVDKELSMAATTASDRLIKFRKDFYMFENRVPHPVIASYLGITNISLSRLRRKLME